MIVQYVEDLFCQCLKFSPLTNSTLEVSVKFFLVMTVKCDCWKLSNRKISRRSMSKSHESSMPRSYRSNWWRGSCGRILLIICLKIVGNLEWEQWKFGWKPATIQEYNITILKIKFCASRYNILVQEGLTKVVWSPRNGESNYEEQRARFLDDYCVIELTIFIDTIPSPFSTLNPNYNYKKIWLNPNLIWYLLSNEIQIKIKNKEKQCKKRPSRCTYTSPSNEHGLLGSCTQVIDS